MSEDKKYVHVSRETVRLFAEQAGIHDVNDEAFGMVAEDCGYRLREATALAAQFMRKNRRRKLTTEDFNKALKAYDVEPIMGFGAVSSTTWKQIPCDPSASPEGTAPLHFADERELNVLSLSLNAGTVANIEVRAPISVSSHWLTQEQYPRILTPAGVTATNATAMSASSMSPSLTSSSPQPHGSPTRKPSSSSAAVQQKKINDALLAYYDATTKAILSKEESVMKVALEDLRTNPRISPLLPYFVNFVTTGVKTLAHDVGQLKKLLHAVKALLRNRQLDFTPKPYLELLLTSTMYCLMEPPVASNGPSDHWTLRDYAAQIMTLIVEGWGHQLPYIKEIALKSLQDVFYDASRPLCSLYGAVVGLTAMGVGASESHLLPHLNSCVARLDSQEEPATHAAKWSHQVDVYHVRGALIAAVEKYLKAKSGEFRREVIESLREQTSESKEDYSKVRWKEESKRENSVIKSAESKRENSVVKSAESDVKSVYGDSYRHFGCSLASRLDLVMNRPRSQREVKPKDPVNLYDDPNEERNGEEMLSELKQQALDERKKRLKEEEEEEEDDEERSYESDEKSDQNGEFDDESVVVKSQISDPGQGIKLTLKLTKRSRTDTHSSIASGDFIESHAPPHKKKKRSRSSRESSAHLGTSSSCGNTPSPASPHRAGRDEPVFQGGELRFSRPPKMEFRVLGMKQRESWDLSRAPSWNFGVDAASSREPVWWKRSGERRLPSMNRVTTAKIKTHCDKERLRRINRSCSIFSAL